MIGGNSPYALPLVPPDDEGISPGEMSMPMQQVVDISTPAMAQGDDGVQFTQLGDGGMSIDFDAGSPEQLDVVEHDANLAEHISESDLSKIAMDVIEWVDADIQARKAWYDRLADGLTLLGVVPDKGGKGPFELANKVNHPVIAEAVVQFQARAMAEMLPPTGPAKGMVLGERTTELEQQAERVADFINYQLMIQDSDYFPETDAMFFMLALEGSQFKKVYKDPLLGRPVSRWVGGADFIVPYAAKSLQQARRYTHQQAVSHNDMLKLQACGFYRAKANLIKPTNQPSVNDKLTAAIDSAQGQVETSLVEDDIDHTMYETTCYYDLPGFEHEDQEGEQTGIALPYIISVEKESQKVMAIRRNWEETDVKQEKITSFVHYPYLPSNGFYSYGLIHMIGGLAHGATGLLRIIMIGGAFASMQGGFKTKSGKSLSSVELEWGVYKDVDATYEEVSRAFYTPAFKEPSEALFKSLGLLVDQAQRFSSTTESMVGDASNTGPVGTTVALIEQGSKVYTGIHKRLHYAQGNELKLLSDLNATSIPEQGYPYAVHGKDRSIARADFSKKIDVLPVSDPNIFSSTQRIAIAQTLIQRSDAHPDLYDRRKVELRFLEAMKVPDPEGVMANKGKSVRTDPITENAMLLVGKPVKVYVDQAHDAHQMVHQRQVDELMARPHGDPIAARALPACISHLAEHMALGIRAKLFQQIGMQMQPLDFDAEGEQPMTPDLPPNFDNQIANLAAQAIAKLPPPQGSPQAAQMQEQAKQMQAQAKQLAADKQAADASKVAAEKATLTTKYEAKIAALQGQLASLKNQMQTQAAAGQHDAALMSAVKEIETLIEHALDQKTEA